MTSLSLVAMGIWTGLCARARSLCDCLGPWLVNFMCWHSMTPVGHRSSLLTSAQGGTAVSLFVVAATAAADAFSFARAAEEGCEDRRAECLGAAATTHVM